MKKLLRIAAVWLLIFVLFVSLFPDLKLEKVLAENAVTVYSEDFESGNFTLETNDDNTVKQLLKDGKQIFAFVKKPGTVFSENFPQTIDEIMFVDNGTNTPVNETKAVNTGNFTLDNNTQMYFNFPQVYNRGIVTVEFRTKRLTKSTTNFFTFYSDKIDSYSPEKDIAYKFEYFVNSSYKSRFRGVELFVDSVTKTSDGYHDTTAAKGWPWIKLEFDLGNKTVTSSYKTSENDSYTIVGLQRPMYANGGGTEADPYYVSPSVGSICVSGEGYAAMDDIVITHTDTENPPVASNLNMTGSMTVGTVLKASYDYSDTEGDAEAGSIITWRRCPDDEFTTYVEEIKSETIDSPTALEYTITEEDIDHYISFAVIPKNNAMVNPVGIEEEFRSSQPARIPRTVPDVSLYNPVNGQYVPAGKPVTISADAKCDNTTITKIEFYVNDIKIGETSQKPYDCTYTFEAPGPYTVQAVAYNAIDEFGVSEYANIIVSPVTDFAVYSDGLSEEISSSIFGTDNLYAKACVNNLNESEISLSSVIAVYDDKNSLLSVAISDVQKVAPGEQIDVTAVLPVNDAVVENAVKVKGFVWDTVTLMPYTSFVSYDVIPDTSGLRNMDIYLILGQSNASGRAGISADCKPTLDNVYLMNRSYEWVAAKNPFNQYNNLGEPSYKWSGNMNFGYPFAKMISQYVPGKQIGIINNAIGGTSLSQWEKGSGTGYYENTMLYVHEALKYGKVKGILWHLGSSDMNKGYTRDEYISKLNDFANSLRSDIGDMTIPFIIGELAPTNEARIEFNKVFMSIAEGDVHVDYSYCVSAEGIVTSDGSHFTSSETKFFGRRYADAILNMVYGIDVPDDIVENYSYNSSYDNLAVNGTVTVSSTNSSSTYDPSYINDGSTDTGWVSGESTSDDAQFHYCTIDLGGAYTIEEIQLHSRTNYNNEEDRANFKILVSNDPSFESYKLFGVRGRTPYPYRETAEYFSVDTEKYRYVKVIKTDDGQLGLSELSVYGY